MLYTPFLTLAKKDVDPLVSSLVWQSVHTQKCYLIRLLPDDLKMSPKSKFSELISSKFMILKEVPTHKE
jgi:hypothetical protein